MTLFPWQLVWLVPSQNHQFVYQERTSLYETLFKREKLPLEIFSYDKKQT